MNEQSNRWPGIWISPSRRVNYTTILISANPLRWTTFHKREMDGEQLLMLAKPPLAFGMWKRALRIGSILKEHLA